MLKQRSPYTSFPLAISFAGTHIQALKDLLEKQSCFETGLSRSSLLITQASTSLNPLGEASCLWPKQTKCIQALHKYKTQPTSLHYQHNKYALTQNNQLLCLQFWGPFIRCIECSQSNSAGETKKLLGTRENEHTQVEDRSSPVIRERVFLRK